MSERQLGVLVQKLDESKLLERARVILSAIHDCGVDTLDDLSIEDRYLLRLTSEYFDGDEALDDRHPRYTTIGNEGVGSKPDDRGVVPVKFELGVFIIEVPMSWKFLTSITTGHVEDLSLVIRKFGDRLERNFGIHYRDAHESARYTPDVEHVHTGFEAGAL